MNTKEYCKRIVEGCKERLKHETDPQLRRSLAIIGEEFNKTYMQLDGDYESLWNYCTRCHQARRKSDFKKQKNEHRSSVCNYCLYPDRRKY